MRQKARSFLHLLLGALLGLLGFSSCGFLDIGGGKDMYGQPYADFQAAGRVTDKSGKGIQGIRVAIQRHLHYDNKPGVIYDQNDWYENDTLYTDASGKYAMKKTIFERPTDVKIVFEDIDGEENGGSFKSQTATPEIRQTAKAKDWYTGGFAVEADARLEKE